MMILPSSVGGAFTEETGYFNAPLATVTSWMLGSTDDSFVLERPAWRDVRDVFTSLEKSRSRSKFALLPIGYWTAILTSGPTGTDVGMLPSYAARQLHCRAIRAVSTSSEDQFPACILEVFGPAGTSPLQLERSIAAANDGGKWTFETHGRPYGFEDLKLYTQRKKSDRFTSEMLDTYLAALGVPVCVEPN